MSRRDLGRLRAGAARIRRVPFTLAFLGTMLAANAAAGTFSGRLEPDVLAARGVGLDAMRDGDPLRLVTATFLSHDPSMLLRQLLFAGAVIGAAEWRWGGRRAAALFFGIDAATTAVLLAAVALVPGLDALAPVTDVGMSLGGFGLLGVLMALRSGGAVWLAVILGLVAAKYALAPDPFADAGHVIALGLGFGIGLFPPRALGRVVDPAAAPPVKTEGRERGQDARR